MADYTLSADTNITAVNGGVLTTADRILLAGFTLTIPAGSYSVQEITAVGNTGKVTFSGTGTYAFTGSAGNGNLTLFKAGTGPLVASTAAAQTITGANFIGGSSNGAYGITTNNGAVSSVTGGSATGTHGVNTNNGTITNSTGGQASSAHGVNSNSGTVASATGGGAATANGVNTNTGIVNSANGGTNATAYGIGTNSSAVICLDSGTSLSNGSAKPIGTGSARSVIIGYGPSITGTIETGGGKVYLHGTSPATFNGSPTTTYLPTPRTRIDGGIE